MPKVSLYPDGGSPLSSDRFVVARAGANKSIQGVYFPIVQVAYLETNAEAHGATTIPYDDTLPQKTEGNEFITTTPFTITPTRSTNNLMIEVVANLSPAAADYVVGALFKNTDADAIAASMAGLALNYMEPLIIRHVMVAGTTSPITFHFRAGGTTAVVTLNGVNSARKYGGSLISSIRVMEIMV